MYFRDDELFEKNQFESSENYLRKLYYEIKKNVDNAKSNFNLTKHASINEGAMTDLVPGFSADILKDADYKTAQFSVLFVDMRNSTNRAQQVGDRGTFITMHAYLPTMINVATKYKGTVFDITGDGLMVLWNQSKESGIRDVVDCSLMMLEACQKVTNKILKEENIDSINIGIGIDCGEVIVTKIGYRDIFDVKVFGNCINHAAHMSDAVNAVKCSERIKYACEKNNDIVFSWLNRDEYEIKRPIFR